MRLPPAALLLLLVPAAGCLGGSDDPAPVGPYTEGYPRYEAANDLYHFELDVRGQLFHFDFAPGAIGKAWNKGDQALAVGLPPTFLLISGANGTSGRFAVAPQSFDLDPGVKQFFLAPPSAHVVNLTVDGVALSFDAATVADHQESTTQVVSGESMVALSELQEERFPHRTPGQPNYTAAIAYFADYFADLGYEVEVDPFGTQSLTDTLGACLPDRARGICPESLANVVATKRGTEDPDRVIFVAGGHFDMVPDTTHAAFDDTSGTVATLELARVMSRYEFRHTIAFGLWGGEEDGILGSQFWVQTHPEMRARILSYWNLDVIGMSWPAPLLTAPDPHVIAAGPDVPAVDPACEPGPCVGTGGSTQDPVSEDLLGWARTLQTQWFGFPDEEDGVQLFHYEGVAAGQAAGYAQVNAQSDHTPFMAAGIPSYFIFNGDALAEGGVGIHNQRDTLANMTKYALYGSETDFDADFASAHDRDLGRAALARSWEAVLLFPFYHALLTDLGVYTPPAVAASAPG